ncbi:PAS domain-containing sensor histidine kinase [Desulfonema ishimotonii]|uniref:histidine kinase n=1 Tax=Desulfonema ishimotonii TaxID=45657 RepID=A0A401FUZ3_9BACT|nr:ATP-binding protein [Desulfonema ishimotonii]GBC60764.1 PAS domain-containing sensor histidine kinase [Desulfonema ishimotonii]
MTISALPIWLVDMAGSVLMIVFSFSCLRHIRELNRRDPGNLIWTYLLWVCYLLAGFAISRSAGHILKQILLVSGHNGAWEAIRPYSGSINTFMLIIVASITLFFGRAWKIYREIVRDKIALQTTHREMLNLNETLERRVRERTEALARSEKQIAQADKLASIGQLSSGIAHEINNPLGVILGYTQLLLRDETPGSQKHDDLKTIEKHVKSCKTIVEDLLHFARSSKPRKEDIDIHKVIDDVLNFIRHRAKSDRLHIEKDYGSNIPPMFMDEKKINQVLINLMMNARHATGNEGTIRITTRSDPSVSRVFISIRDTGYGIEEKNLSRIFDPFFTTKPTGEGTGLGLAVSYGIIKNHGGDIRAESTPGNGAVFTIILPVSARNERNV